MVVCHFAGVSTGWASRRAVSWFGRSVCCTETGVNVIRSSLQLSDIGNVSAVGSHFHRRGYCGKDCYANTKYLITYLLRRILLDVEVEKCAGFNSESNSRCRSCWRTLSWLDNWKRALLYVVLSVGCFVRLPRVWLTAISGLVFVAVATVYRSLS